MKETSSRNRTLFKGGLIAVLTLLLLIPTIFISNLIQERQLRKSSVTREIGEKWGLAQTINGPMLKIPFYENVEVFIQEGKKQKKEFSKVLKYKFISPEIVTINSKINPQLRKRGIFEVIVYQSDISLNGSFKDLMKAFTTEQRSNILWDKAEIIVGLSDLRGLKNEVKLQWNKKEYPISGSEFVDPHFGNGIVAQIPIEMNNLMENSFQVNLNLNGSENLDFIALGKNNKVNVISKWANPSFSGSFLPDTRKISKDGFDASWSISHLNRNLPAHWENNEFPIFTEGKFGLNLINPNDNYQKSERSVKYAILIIALTFLAFFFVELLSQQRIHPFQYLLVGFALCIFYILLISFSEIMLFNLAYLLGSIMTLGLVFFYSKSIFNKPSISVLVTAILTVLYLFIFVIIQLQDTALLIGSLGLFIILAITMFVSRRINWQNEEA